MKANQFFSFFAMLFVIASCGNQTTRTNDAQLVSVNDSDEYMPEYGIDPTHEVPCPEFESLEEAEAVFVQSGINYCFCQFIANHPATMNYDFSALQKSDNMPVTIADAPDQSFRIYGWNNHMGGTCISWSVIYQIADKGQVYTYEGLPDWNYDPYLITEVYQLPHKTRHLYIFSAYFREWSSLSYRGFIAYERKGHELKRVKLFRDKNGELTDEIGFEYNVPDYYFRYATHLSYNFQYTWNADESTLYIPIGRTEDATILTDRFVRYRWNGKTLTPTDTVSNPFFHPSVAGYQQVEQILQVEYHLVRIDSMPDGRLRYISWAGREIDITEEPALILYGNTVGNEYRFYNRTYTYIVTKDEYNPEIRIYYSETPGKLGKLQSTYTTQK